MIGDRVRRTIIPNWTPTSVGDFRSRAAAYEQGAEVALSHLAAQIGPALEAGGKRIDAVITTTSTGNLMPGLSYRLASRLSGLLRSDTLLIDLANVGCTGGIKALNLATQLNQEFRNILVVSVELPTTLIDFTGSTFDLWQGNCTFGDGAAALWISDDAEAGALALEIEQVSYKQFSDTGLDLIRWGYHNYYRFALADQVAFENEVQRLVGDALAETEAGWKEVPRWAVHAAGISLLVRLARKLGIPRDALTASASHYRNHSNMSSASVLFVLEELARDTPAGGRINMLTMGAGFNVIYGRVHRIR
jgi:predicted naringenin-chalcone synthase